MGRARPTVIGIESGVISLGAPTTTTMVDRYRGRNVGGNAIEAGGHIDLSAAGPVDVIIRDQNGVELFNTLAVTADTTVAPVPRGVKLPLEVVTENITGTLEVFWSVKK